MVLLTVAEKFTASAQPIFKRPLFRIEWQSLSVACGYRYARREDHGAFDVAPGFSPAFVPGIDGSITSDIKRPVMNTCRKRGVGHPLK